MNNHTDPWEAEMSREFDQRVRDLHEAPLTFDHVKGRAMKIRRTRRVAVAGGILAAAAVIVPVSVFAGQGLTDNDSGPGFADPTTNPTAIDPNAPGFGYLEGSTLHLADGSTVELPRRYDRATMLGDKLLAARNNDETGFDTLDVIDETGSVTDTTETVSDPVANADHTTVAYVETDGDLVIHWEGGRTVIASGLDTNVFPAAVTGCDQGGVNCRVYANDGALGTPTVFDAIGGREVDIPRALTVNGADDAGLVTVQNDSQIEGSCGGIYDENAADYVWETCKYYLYALSPDSQYVNATHPYLDGNGTAYCAILDVETQKEVARFEPEEGSIRQTVWQDAQHLLLTMYDADGWSIYRLGVDGTTEQLAGTSTEGDEDTPAYVLLGGS